MATVVTPPAASAPAEPLPNFSPETYTPEQHAEWMNKGTIPQSNPAESTPAKTPAGTAKADEPAAASATAPTQEHKGKGADARKAELNAEIQDLLKKRAELRAEVDGKTGVTAEPPTAKPKEPKLEKPKAPVFGEDGHDGENWQQFEARREAHTEALAEYKAKEVLRADREQREKERLEADTKAANQAIEESWKARLETAQAKHADFAEVAFSKDVQISPVMDGFILDSDIGPEILYYFGSHVDEANAIAAMPPYKAARALAKIESGLGEPSGESPKPKTPVTPITKAAKPATDLRATQSAPTDERAAAIEANDVTRFIEIENAKTVAKRKRG